MQHSIPNSFSRFQGQDTQPISQTRLPICSLVLLVSIPAALLTAIIMAFVHVIRFITKSS